MYTQSDIRAIHLEVTTHCNAHCPQCPRNIDGGARNPNMPLTQLYLADIEKIFPRPDFPNLKRIQVCGNYGDAIMARDFLEIARYLKSLYPHISITLATNGSLRPVDWWRDLAVHVDHCVFGIDGLADTHALYRRGTDFDTIIANAKAYIAGGGRAEWAYLIFRHNQHQVDEAHRLSQELGFHEFSAKATSRFYDEGRKAATSPVRDESGEIVYRLEAPSDVRLGNAELDRLDQTLLGDAQKFNDYITSTKIDCKAISRAKLYISGEGHVFPCCWVGNIYPSDKSWRDTQRGGAILRSGGLDLLDAKIHPIGAILEGEFFKRTVPEAWKCGPDRLKVCSKMCGEVDINLAQYVDYTPRSEDREEEQLEA